MILIDITEDGVCTSRDGLPNRRKPVLRDPRKGFNIGTPIENINVALDLLIPFRIPSYLYHTFAL